jgi:hypothetical protein
MVPSSLEHEATFSAAVDRLRYLTTWRLSHIHPARISTRAGTLRRTGPDAPLVTHGKLHADLVGVNCRQDGLIKPRTRSRGPALSGTVSFGRCRCGTSLLYSTAGCWTVRGSLARRGSVGRSAASAQAIAGRLGRDPLAAALRPPVRYRSASAGHRVCLPRWAGARSNR